MDSSFPVPHNKFSLEIKVTSISSMEIALITVSSKSIGGFLCSWVIGSVCVFARNLFVLMPERVSALENLMLLAGMSFY